MTKRLLHHLPYSPSHCSRFFWLVRYRCLVGLALLLMSFTAWAQSSTQDLLPPKFIPKSPTISSFARFDGQQLINLPTGASQLAVPLAEVNCGTLRLPVSLAYTYTGLKIGQPYDFVGLGWALQAGVSITRQVSGLVDDNYATDPYRRYNPDSMRVGVNKPRFLKRITQSDVDTGPDVYSFSLPGGASGHFIILDTTITLLPQQPVHIRYTSGANYRQGFQITTEDGIRYQFQAVEITRPNPNNFSLGAGTSEHATAWHLTRLISADNADTIRLHYSLHSERAPQTCTVTTGRYYTGVRQLNGTVYDPNNPDGDCGSTASYPFHNVLMWASILRTQYLDSITTRGQSLRFTRADVFRGGVSSGQELRGLQLVSFTGERREIKRITLYQSHFEAVGNAGNGEYRLRLDSLQESANELRLPAYRFHYLEGALPPRGSAAMDYWGYSNGATTNGDVFTTTAPTLLNDPQLIQGGYRPANREPDFTSAAAGALTQVKYPTGGTARWEYEPSRLPSDIGDIPLSYLVADVGTGFNAATAQQIPGGPRLPATTSDELRFQVPIEGDIRVVLHRRPNDSTRTTGGTNTYRDFNIWHQLATGDTLITNSTGPGSYKVLDGQGTEKTFMFHVQPGAYSARVYCETLELQSDITIYIPYRDSTLLRVGLPGPGIRVLRTTAEAAGMPPLIHTYTYLLGGRPSGHSLLPDAGKKFDKYTSYNQSASGGQGITTGTRCQFINTSSDNRGLGDEFNKYDFYYTCVSETQGVNQGATVHYFDHQPQQFNDVVPTAQLSYRLDANKTQKPIQQVHYTYVADSTVRYPLLRVRIVESNSGNAFNPGIDGYDPTQYQLFASLTLPAVTEQSLYDAQGAASTTLTRSTYLRQRLIRSATRTSTGWRIQRFKRLSDYAPLAAVTALRVNSFNPVIETQTWQRPLLGADSVLVAGQLTLYDPQWRSPARAYRLRVAQPLAALNQEGLLNGRYASLLSDSRYEPVARVRYANGTGDVVEQRVDQGQPTSFLMGYDHTLVIAEAKNASYAQVAYTSFEPTATGRWQYDSTGTHRVLGGRAGRWAYQLDGTASVSRRQLPVGDYEFLYWVQSASSPTVTAQGGSQLSSPQLIAIAPDNWHQFRTRLHFTTAGQVSLDVAPGAPNTRLDELRLYPVGAQFTSYTHDPLIGVTSQTDPTGRTIFYEYDALGRLLRTRDEQGRILSQQQYHYAGQ